MVGKGAARPHYFYIAIFSGSAPNSAAEPLATPGSLGKVPSAYDTFHRHDIGTPGKITDVLLKRPTDTVTWLFLTTKDLLRHRRWIYPARLCVEVLVLSWNGAPHLRGCGWGCSPRGGADAFRRIVNASVRLQQRFEQLSCNRDGGCGALNTAVDTRTFGSTGRQTTV